LEIKKTIPKVQTNEDLQQFLQGQTASPDDDSGGDIYAPTFQFGQ
jgi:hypothetical protein